MPFIDKSTLTFPATSSFPIRRWLDPERDPSSSDYKSFKIFDLWINDDADRAWIMVDRTATSGTWVQMNSTGTGILTITGDSGGAVGADGGNNINLLSGSHLTVTGDSGTNTLTITLDDSIANQFDTDSGSATAASGVLNILGTGGTVTSASGNTVTITSGTTVPTFFITDAGTAVPSLNTLNIVGDGDITTSASGATLMINTGGSIATTFTCDSGTATPSTNNINIIGGGGASTVGSGSTVTINSSGGGITWNEQTVVGPTSMAVDHGYIANIASPSVVGFTLPLTSILGSIICVIGKGSGGWSIAQNAGQSIREVDSVTTVGVGGSVASSEARANLCMVCVTADTDWIIYSSSGNLIFT